MSFWRDWSDGKKWAMGILGSLLVMALGTGTGLLLRGNRNGPEHLSQEPNASERSTSTGPNALPVEQTPAQISAALGSSEIDRAIGFLKGLPSGAAKEDECERLFSFCMKHSELGGARLVVDECWIGGRQQTALQDIALARLKLPESTGRTRP